MEELLPGADIRYYSFARRALADGLRLSRAGKVLLPGFLCRDVLSSLSAVGAEAAFYPVDSRLNPAAAPEAWPKADAVLAVDYFGFPQDLTPFKAYCARTGAVLIEDAAHALFSRDASGALLGSPGDLGLFRLRKTCRCQRRGAADESGLVPPQGLRRLGGVRSALKRTSRALARRLGSQRTYQGLSFLRDLRRLKTGSRLPSPDAESERVLPKPERPCRALAVALTAADPQAEAQRRRALYAFLSARLHHAGAEPIFDALPLGVVPYGLPYRAEGKTALKVEALLKGLGLESLTWPDLPSAIMESAPSFYKDVRIVHFLW